jgi:thioredoxin-related protein
MISPPAAARAAARVEFLPLEAALAKSRGEGKFTMLFFWTASCPYCRYFSDEVLTDPKVAADLNRGFVVVSIDSDRERALARRYRVNAVPRLVFLDPGGAPATVLPGALKPPLFRLFLAYVASNSFRTMRFDEFVESLMAE